MYILTGIRRTPIQTSQPKRVVCGHTDRQSGPGLITDIASPTPEDDISHEELEREIALSR